MCCGTWKYKIIVAVATGLFFSAGMAKADSVEAKFHRAYYLQHEANDPAGAADLYKEVLSARGADAELKAKAKTGLAICREDAISSDLARLMPANAFAYIELSQPGEQIKRLLADLGILGVPGEPPPEGQRVAVSPALIDTLGIRGAAVGITGINPQNGEPTGVLVLHPGDVDPIRGLLETGLPAGGQAVEAIGGFPTYHVENEAYVTLTNRLVIASTELDPIRGVVSRLTGESSDSLAANPEVGEMLKGREDALLTFFVYPEPIMPMITGILEAEAARDPEAAMVMAMLDVKSLHSLTGQLGVNDHGLFVDVALTLDEGHQNLVYNFLRTPAIDRDALKSIPHGAAGFLVGALNEADSRHAATPTTSEPPIVTGLDFGREIFANIATIALYVLPPDAAGKPAGPPIPDVAAAIRVNDPAKSEALWTTVLGLASMAAGAPSIEGDVVQIEGVAVRNFALPEGITVYFASLDHNVVIATSKMAVARSIQTQRGGKSILQDKAFASSLPRVGPDSTKAVFVHPGRVLQICKPFMSKGDLAEVAPFESLLSDTVASLVVEHSSRRLSMSIEVSGIPEVGALLSELIAAEQREEQQRSQLSKAMRTGDWDDALSHIDHAIAGAPSTSLVQKKFQVLAVGKKDRAGALAVSEKLFKAWHDNAQALNNFAWALLTDDDFGGEYPKLALKFAERSNEVEPKNWAYVDTLALAKFETGDRDGAIAAQQTAIALADGKSKKTLEETLERFQSETE